MTKTTKTAKTAKAEANTAIKAIRKGFYAYVGAYGAAYERIQPMIKTVSKNYDEFAQKGEKMEKAAQAALLDTRKKAEKTFAQTKDTVMSVLPVSANDRVEELEAEIARLNKKLKAPVKKAKKKTAVKKSAAKKAA